MATITIAQSMDIAELSKDLFSDIITTNAVYLGLSVSIILGSGLILSILMYFLNFKPMKEGLNKQADDIEKIKDETELKVENLKISQSEVSNSIETLRKENKDILKNLKEVSAEGIEIVEKLFEEKQKEFNDKIKIEIKSSIEEINSKISLTEKSALGAISELDLSTTWNMHYMWQAKDVQVNAFGSIVATLEKAIGISSTSVSSYNTYVKLALDRLPKVIDDVISDDPKTFIETLPIKIVRLETCLSLIKNYEVEKKTVTIKIEELRKAIA